MTIIRELAEETKTSPDKIKVTGYCCNEFKDIFLNNSLQFNINFIDHSMDIQVIGSMERVAFVFTNVRNCMNCGEKIRILSLEDVSHSGTKSFDITKEDCKLCG
jgi:hypothetical protein